MDDDYDWRARDPGEGREIFQRLVRRIVAHEGQQPKGTSEKKQGVSVRLRFAYEHCGDRHVASPVIYYDLLSQAAGEPLRNGARNEITGASGFGGDDTDRLVREILPERRARKSPGKKRASYD